MNGRLSWFKMGAPLPYPRLAVAAGAAALVAWAIMLGGCVVQPADEEDPVGQSASALIEDPPPPPPHDPPGGSMNPPDGKTGGSSSSGKVSNSGDHMDPEPSPWAPPSRHADADQGVPNPLDPATQKH